MNLRRIDIRNRLSYDPLSELIGSVELEGADSSITLPLSYHTVSRIIQLVKDDAVEEARRNANMVASSLTEAQDKAESQGWIEAPVPATLVSDEEDLPF